MAKNDFRDLVAWQQGSELVMEIYDLTGKLPKEEIEGLTGQMRRAAINIPAKLARGYGVNRRKSIINGLLAAHGYLKELESHLLVAVKLGLVYGDDIAPALDQCRTLGQEIEQLEESLFDED
ncbi:four helix bundle protein [Stratiformator vulcanicus]|uniref:Four helix bundle protein n=1 Tax=Stratiformator vulcanicus TaxID=2527980 RepID=A0A517R7R2_9PLAN|nr:four helix bundle protein [Stratiformator vulcanicus]QDT39924.1 hypothetical protein Pan189_43360 [Stratiformator vulcanicus]